MRKKSTTLTLSLAVVAWLAPAWASAANKTCSDGSQPAYWVAPMDPDFRRQQPGKSPMGMDLVPYCESASQSADVEIDPAMVQNLGLKTASVEQRSLTPEIAAVGQIQWDESRLQRITARAAGWIQTLGVESTGETVQPGQMLYQIYAPDMYAAEAQYLALAGKKTTRGAAVQRLHALGYSSAQIKALQRAGEPQQSHRVTATSARRVVQLQVRAGDYVQPATPLMTLGDLSQVWLIVQVPERDAAQLFMGQSVDVTLPALPGQSWQGQVVHIHPELDRKTRNLRARVVLDNPDQSIKPGMFASLMLQAEATPIGTVVPSQSIIRTQDSNRVIVARGAGRFDVMPVELGVAGQGYTQVSGSLQAGDEVVMSGQFLLDSQANISAELLRLRSEQAAMAASPDMSKGTVVAIDAQRRFITLDHAYIASIDMPAMVMSFDLADDLSLDNIAVGDQLHFTADSPQAGQYRITSLQVVP